MEQKKALNGEKFTGRKFNIAVTYVHKQTFEQSISLCHDIASSQKRNK